MATDITALSVRVGADLRDYERGMARLSSSLKRTENQVERTSSMIARHLTRAFTAGAIGAAVWRAAGDVDRAMSQIRSETGATGKAFDALAASFSRVDRAVSDSADSVAAAISALNGGLGVTGPLLDRLTRQMLDYARANREDVATSAQTAARLLNALEVPAAALPAVLDKLTLASQKSGIGVNELANLIIEAGPAFEQMGFNLDRAIGLFAEFYRAGANPREVLSSLNIVLTNLAREGFTDAEAAFNELLRRIKNAPGILQATTIAADAFGARVGAKVAEDIRAGRFEVDAWVEALQDAQGTVRRTAREAETFGQQFARAMKPVQAQLAALGSVAQSVARLSFPMLGAATTAVAGIIGVRLVAALAAATRGAIVLRGALALIGGVPGLVIAALGLIVGKLIQVRQEAKLAADEVKEAVAEIASGFALLDERRTLLQMGKTSTRIGELQEELRLAKKVADERAQTRWISDIGGTRRERVWRKDDAKKVAELTTELEIQKGAATELAQQYGMLARGSDEAGAALNNARSALALTSENFAELTRRLQSAEDSLAQLKIDQAITPAGEALDRVNKAMEEQRRIIKAIRGELARYTVDISNIPTPDPSVGASARIAPRLRQSEWLMGRTVRESFWGTRYGVGAARMESRGTAVDRAQAEVQRWLDTPGITAAALASKEFAGELERVKGILDEEAKRREEINKLLGLEQKGILEGLMAARSLSEAFRMVRDRIYDSVKSGASGVKDALTPAFEAFKGGDILGGLKEGLGAALSGLKVAFTSIVTSAGPLILLFELFRGIMDAIREPLQALLLPIRMLGEVIGRMLVPMFKLLFPVLKAVAIAVSYVAQVFYTISGYLLTAVGAVVEAIGKLVKWLSFGTVKAIQNAGSAIRQSGRETLAAAEDMKEFRRDLRDLSWDDAMARVADSANKAADALLGVPEGFKVALARFNASDARGVVPSAAAGMGASAGTRIENHVPVTIHVHANERTDVRSLVDQITREFRREAHRGGVTGLDLVIGAT